MKKRFGNERNPIKKFQLPKMCFYKLVKIFHYLNRNKTNGFQKHRALDKLIENFQNNSVGKNSDKSCW